MKRSFEFCLATPGLERVRFLVERSSMPTNGDTECAFLDGISGLVRHPAGQDAPTVLCAALARERTDILVVIRNPDLVLDPQLGVRIAAAISGLPAADGWSIAGAGGLGLGDRRHLSLYASDTPSLPEFAGPQPLLDVMPDIYLVNASFALPVLQAAEFTPSAGLEPFLATEGYLQGRTAIFLPKLVAGINGQLMARNLDGLTQDLNTAFGDRLRNQVVWTLSGPIRIAAPQQSDQTAPQKPFQSAVESAVLAHADPISLSVVVRTRFGRPHLLDRLLASISRARIEHVPLEIILSSDADPALCQAETDRVRQAFCNLSIRLQVNRPGTHSRVVNLLGGLSAANHDYVMLIDDDDYVDLFAFDSIAFASFMGNQPLIVTTSKIHEETWEETPSGRWVLSGSKETGCYDADGWMDMFTGINKLPVCALVLPRERLMTRLNAFDFRYDLSEDYALFLLVLTDPDLPGIHPSREPFCHISVRGQENSITMQDRRPWVRDITGFLSDLVSDPRVAGLRDSHILSDPVTELD